jgi:hypothetical protein
MDLTRYWRLRHKGTGIEVQWTGTRFNGGGWTLRLLVDGKPQAESKSFKRDIVLTGQAGGDPIQVHFKSAGLFRNRCVISAGGVTLADSTQPWNALILGIFCAIWGIALATIAADLVLSMNH